MFRSRERLVSLDDQHSSTQLPLNARYRPKVSFRANNLRQGTCKVIRLLKSKYMSYINEIWPYSIVLRRKSFR
jgi:hypothetical protein